jgi:hypothetical protein
MVTEDRSPELSSDVSSINRLTAVAETGRLGFRLGRC